MKTSVRSFAIRPTLKSSFHVVAFLLCSVTILNFVGSGQLSFFVTDSSEGQICRVEVEAVVCELNCPSVRKMKTKTRETYSTRTLRRRRRAHESEESIAMLGFLQVRCASEVEKDSTLLFVRKTSRRSPFILPETNQERRGNRCQSTR